ncbi:MAG: LysM peptidoglycan-binding domain-containing protein [Thermodesulfobacteriota bacterium]
MKKLLVSTLIVSGLAITGASSFAVDEQPKDAPTEQQQQGAEPGAETQTEIRGEVTSFQDSTIEIKDEAGQTHSFDITGLENAEELKAEALKPGDMVRVEMASGKATLIEKVEAKSDASTEEAPEVAEEPQDAESMKKEDAGAESEASAPSDSDVAKEDAESMKEDAAPEDAAPAEGLEGQEQAAEVGEGEYIVKEGDTLATIAEQHLGSQDQWSVIAKANNLEDPDRIFVGQRLTIPSGDTGSEKLNQEEAPAPQTEPMKDETGTETAPENY